MPTPVERRRELEMQTAWLESLVAQAQLSHWYGKLIITMEDGEVKRVVKEESLKPPLRNRG